MKEYYQVKTVQEIPYAEWDDDFGDFAATETTGRVEEQIAGTFPALHLAQTFANALEQKIAEGAGFITNRFTPKVVILKVEKHITEMEVNHG